MQRPWLYLQQPIRISPPVAPLGSGGLAFCQGKKGVRLIYLFQASRRLQLAAQIVVRLK